MDLDLRQLPYSARGSFLAVSFLGGDWLGQGNEAGLYLRTLRGAAWRPLVARIQPGRGGGAPMERGLMRGAALEVGNENGRLELCFANEATLLIRGGAGTELTLDFLTKSSPFDYIYPLPSRGGSLMVANCYKNAGRYLLCAQKGDAALEQQWNGKSADYTVLRVSGADGFVLSITELQPDWDGQAQKFDFDAAKSQMGDSLSAFQSALPDCPAAYRDSAEKAGYLMWESIVRKGAGLPREAMLMSKNWMKKVWSWDHCFNAVALSFKQPQLAWDQFMILFDCQAENGALPDAISDSCAEWNFCKPPIHGWALCRMLKNMTLSRAQTQEAYERLSRWTNWWLSCRDCDGDGLCEYVHGNDSGWDNSTVFHVLPPIASPDLQAFLILQMDALSLLAQRLGNESDARAWRERSEELLKRTLERLFVNDLPVARASDGSVIETRSLLPYISLILGQKLPERIRSAMLQKLSGDEFQTGHGFATESPHSPCYVPDGYWRGPIWAPATLLLVDGLAACGEEALARETALRFAAMCEQSGFAENFDALTGAGLRDRAYSWTASVFLILAHEYL